MLNLFYETRKTLVYQARVFFVSNINNNEAEYANSRYN